MNFFKKSSYPVHLGGTLTFRQQAIIFAWEVFKVVVISLVIIVPIRYYVIKPFYVKGASMEPNFHDHEYLIIDEISYRFNQPERGEIVVFKDPLQSGQYLIKRIIALPNERVTIKNGLITVYTADDKSGILLQEPYLEPGTKTNGTVEVVLSPDEYLVLGDNRTHSLDSRIFGPIKRQAIIGRVWWRGWPLDKMGVLTQPVEYNF